MSRGRIALVALATLLLAGSCGGPPRKALADAQAALSGAHDAEDCAPEEYAAARKMLDRALAASDAKEYDKARQYAAAAKALAEKAALKAQQNLSRCRATAGDPADDDDDGPEEPLLQPQFDDDWTLQTVYFGFNAAELSPDSQEILRKNARWILRNSEVRVLIAGHCDERGSTGYNLALGEQRAMGVKKFLSQMGVPPERIGVISYGEELPIDGGMDEGAFARNRRAEFRVQ